jgi:hypothetical protein
MEDRMTSAESILRRLFPNDIAKYHKFDLYGNIFIFGAFTVIALLRLNSGYVELMSLGGVLLAGAIVVFSHRLVELSRELYRRFRSSDQKQ